ncbi:hypothetical protein CDAR_367041 [Caerostris darwini]|uniref:Uncharacterized protein n=1 Tax=Caerostris darwini TaxID=1538125 RepID=A0AAV4WK20_9ARAC|nr:hypothetical protein CDAR_367041 [Caerostris darwini]
MNGQHPLCSLRRMIKGYLDEDDSHCSKLSPGLGTWRAEKVDDASKPESDPCPFRDSSCHSPTPVSDAGPICLVIWNALKELCNLDFYIRRLPETKILANIIIMHLLDIQR